MSTRSLAQILTLVQFVTAGGRRLAVIDADGWEELMAWLEDSEDKRAIQQSLARLRAGPEASGAIPLEKALDELY
jgi:hypothetical protein